MRKKEDEVTQNLEISNVKTAFHNFLAKFWEIFIDICQKFNLIIGWIYLQTEFTK